MSDEAERVHGYRFPGNAPSRAAPRPSGTLEEILAGLNAPQTENRIDADFDRIERALARLEQAVREALEQDQR
jgi:hypothetical protein